MMDEREYREFLGEVADRVSRMVAGKRDLAASKFHSSCEAFCRQVDLYCKRFDCALKKAEGEGKRKRKLQNYNEGKPPKPGWEWVDSSWKSGTELRGFWSEPLPLNLDSWLRYYYGGEVLLFDGPEEHDDSKTPKGPDDNETKVCEYVVLGLVHDKVKGVPKSRRLCTIDNDDWRHTTWDDLLLPDMALYEQGDRKRRRFEDVLATLEADMNQSTVSTEVEADLAKQPAKAVRKTERSLPLPMVKWAYIFGVSANKLRDLRREEKYHFSKVSARLWTLPKDELPTEYLERYRQHTSRTHLKAQ